MEESDIYDKEKRFSIYYAHPYSSWERWCNENKNKEIRLFIRKSKNIDEISDEYIKMVMIKINNKPRKSLNYKSALEVYIEELKKLNKDTNFLDEYKDSTIEWKKNIKISWKIKALHLQFEFPNRFG